jgi:large subunit ribosomal protein L17
MIHRVFGRKLGRNTNQRKGLFRNLANAFILNEKIVTTEAKAKAVRPLVEKLITRAKEDTIHNRRVLIKELTKENSVKKMLEVIGPRFKERSGGYTRIVKMGKRFGDQAPLVALTFTEDLAAVEVQKPEITKAENASKEVKIKSKTKKVSQKKALKKKTNGKEK